MLVQAPGEKLVPGVDGCLLCRYRAALAAKNLHDTASLGQDQLVPPCFPSQFCAPPPGFSSQSWKKLLKVEDCLANGDF